MSTPLSGDSGASNDLFTNNLGFNKAVEIGCRGFRLPPDQVVAVIAGALSYCFKDFGLPLQLWGLVITIIAASQGNSDWFDLSDRQLVAMVYPNITNEAVLDTLRRKLQRWRKKFEKWQVENGIFLVEIENGTANYERDDAGDIKLGRDGKPRVTDHEPTKYKHSIFPKLKWIDERISRIAGMDISLSSYSDRLNKSFVASMRQSMREVTELVSKPTTKKDPYIKIKEGHKGIVTRAKTHAQEVRDLGGNVRLEAAQLCDEIMKAMIEPGDHEWIVDPDDTDLDLNFRPNLIH